LVGVGAALLTALAVLLASLAFIIYFDIFICSASLAGCVSSLLSFSLANLAGCLLWRRPGVAGRRARGMESRMSHVWTIERCPVSPNMPNLGHLA
jgi:hypothetical protein